MVTSAIQQNDPGKRRMAGRSPSYPGIGLEEAIEKAEVIYQREAKHSAPVSAIVRHWGYKSESGSALVAVAALKKFGLVTDEGKGEARRVRLSDLALGILLDQREDRSARQTLLREAALLPTIHRVLWDRYGGKLPSESTLRYDLLKEYNFTESAVREFIPQFRGTLEFTGLLDSDTVGGRSEDKNDSGGSGTMPHTPLAPPPPAHNPPPPPPPTDPSGGISRDVPIAISLEKWATLKITLPLSEAEWQQMLAVLQAMKPAMVTPTPSEKSIRTLRTLREAQEAMAGDNDDEDEDEE